MKIGQPNLTESSDQRSGLFVTPLRFGQMGGTGSLQLSANPNCCNMRLFLFKENK